MQVNHLDVVQRLHAEQPPEHTIEGALAFTVRVIRALPASEGAGLLMKTAGENIAPYVGTMVSAGRVCYPDGQLYKVLSDIPTTLAPIWNDDGTVDPARWVRVSAAAPPPTPEPLPPPTPDDGDDWPEILIAAIERILHGVEGLATAVDSLQVEVKGLRDGGLKVKFK